MVGLAGLDVPIEPAGVSVLAGGLAAFVIRRVCEDRQVLRRLAHQHDNMGKCAKPHMQYT